MLVIPAFRLGFTGQFSLGDNQELIPNNLGVYGNDWLIFPKYIPDYQTLFTLWSIWNGKLPLSGEIRVRSQFTIEANLYHRHTLFESEKRIETNKEQHKCYDVFGYPSLNQFQMASQ